LPGFLELDTQVLWFGVVRCVINGLLESHVTREVIPLCPRRVYMNFLNENQRRSAKSNWEAQIVQINRT